MSHQYQLEQYQAACECAIQQAVAAQFQEDSAVAQAAAYTLLNGGKRVRGSLLLAVCSMLSEEGTDVAGPLAAAVEMVHAFSLIHDDLPCMDNDDFRRGKPACHIAYGQATALLAGDMLALEAFHCIVGAPLPAEYRVQAVGMLAAAAGSKGMIYGQELDLLAEDSNTITLLELDKIQSKKTGDLLLAAAHLGVIAAQQNLDKNASITLYAQNIGKVFQIIDDILDENSNTEELGKPIHSDAQNNKQTYLTLLGAGAAFEKAENLTEEAVAALLGAYGNRADFLCWFARGLLNRQK